MSSRELIALGTASQVPTRTRNHNGYLLAWEGEGFLFDPGEGTQRQMTMANVAVSSIHRVLITHFHGDHCLGLSGIVQRLSLDRVERPIEVYYPASGQVYFERLRHASQFVETATLVPHPVEAEGKLDSLGSLEVITRRLNHTVDCWGYRVQEESSRALIQERLDELGLQGPVVGQLLRDGAVSVDGREVTLEEVSVLRPGQSFAFVMDTAPCAGAVELARGADMLLCESTYLSSEQREAEERGHMTAADAGRLAAEAGVGRLVLTHFSQRYRSVEPFLEEARSFHPDVVAVQDGDRVPLPRRARDPQESGRVS